MSDSHTAETVTSAPDPGEAEHLHCPRCDYDLSGTVEDRCSECGEPFDRETLIAWYAEGCDPLLRIGGSSLGVLALWWKAIFSPAKLGRHFPPRPDSTWVWVSSLSARLIAALIIPAAVAARFPSAPNLGAVVPLSILPVLLASYLCELLLAALLAGLAAPAGVPRRDRLRFWKLLCQCYTIYLPFSAAMAWASWLCGWKAIAGLPEPLSPAVAVVIVCWWINLGVAVCARIRGAARRLVALSVIILVTWCSVFFGNVLGAAQVAVLFVIGHR